MKTIFILFASCLLFTLTASATKYYVSPSGNNSNAGLSGSASFLTIDKGISTASNYDTVVVMTGTYTISAALAINKPLTLLGQGAQIDGGSWSPSTQNKRLFSFQAQTMFWLTALFSKT